jgi:hypothetical protein
MSTELLNPSETANVELGRELTLRYNRAINAWGAILHFGAMLAQLETHLTASLPSNERERGRYVKGSGLKGFLDTYAPEIDERKARRIRDVAQAVAEREKIDIALFTEPVEALPAADRKKIEGALSFLEEKNMKAVQLELGLVSRMGAAAKGGDLGGRRKAAADMTAAEIAQAQEATRAANEKEWTAWLDMLEASGLRIPQWSCLPLHKLERMSSLLLDVRKLVDQAIATERRSQKGGRS